jgi:hypothetical protein
VEGSKYDSQGIPPSHFRIESKRPGYDTAITFKTNAATHATLYSQGTSSKLFLWYINKAGIEGTSTNNKPIFKVGKTGEFVSTKSYAAAVIGTSARFPSIKDGSPIKTVEICG